MIKFRRWVAVLKFKALMLLLAIFMAADKKLNAGERPKVVGDRLVLGEVVDPPYGCNDWRDRDEDANC